MRIFLERGFDAAHVLRKVDKDDDWNIKTFGKCCGLHGHFWLVQVMIEGKVNEETGMIINFNEIKKVIDQFDHELVNKIISLPTVENIVTYILNELKKIEDTEGMLTYIKVRVYETKNAYAEEEWRSE